MAKNKYTVLVPITDRFGIKRSVQSDEVKFLLLQDQIIFVYTLFCYDPETEKEIPTMRRTSEVTASMDNFVDAKGDYVEPDAEGAIPEYVFWMEYLQNNSFDVRKLFPIIVDRLDKVGRFNI